MHFLGQDQSICLESNIALHGSSKSHEKLIERLLNLSMKLSMKHSMDFRAHHVHPHPMVFAYVFRTFATFPSNLMESIKGGGLPLLLWRRPKAASIKLDGNVANVRKTYANTMGWGCTWWARKSIECFIESFIERFNEAFNEFLMKSDFQHSS